MRFNNFVTKTLKYKGGLSALINNTEMTDSQKIKMIDVWWNQFNPKNILQLFKMEEDNKYLLMKKYLYGT